MLKKYGNLYFDASFVTSIQKVKSRTGDVEQYDLSISINGGGMLYIDIQSEKERDDMIQSIINGATSDKESIIECSDDKTLPYIQGFKDGVEHSLNLAQVYK